VGNGFLLSRGCAELIDLFKAHEGIAESLGDKERLGMFFSEIGMASSMREQFAESYTYLIKALELGEQATSPKVIGHSCYRLSNTCAQLGKLDEAVKYGERARELSEDPRVDLPLSRVVWGLSAAYWYRGDIKKLREFGRELLDEGKRRADPRDLASGEMALGLSYFCAGDFQSAIDSFKATLKASIDPLLIQMATMFLGYAYLADGQYQEALSVSEEVIRFSEKYGPELLGTPALTFKGFALAATQGTCTGD
jgi:tetratricopeptide (TPR) repeat protein